tara:strand:+ start:913 stop:1044 length:132 start_codon:yes stop_codon:yes gene_type:complete
MKYLNTKDSNKDMILRRVRIGYYIENGGENCHVLHQTRYRKTA